MAGRWGRAWLRLVSAFAGGCLLLGGVVACSDAEAGPEPEDTPVVDTSVDVDGDAAADGDEDELGGDDVEEYEHPVPGPDFDDEGQAGAEAAAVYFAELYSYVYATADFEAWDEISESECGFCLVTRQQVAEIYDSGGYATKGPPVVHETTSQLGNPDDHSYVVELRFRDSESVVFDAQGAVIRESPAGEVRAWFLVQHDTDDWRLSGVEAEAVADG